MKIFLNDILNISDLNNVKIRFVKEKKGVFDPLKSFKEDKKKLFEGLFWNYSKKKSFREGEIVIGLVKIEADKWLLFNISLINLAINIAN